MLLAGRLTTSSYSLSIVSSGRRPREKVTSTLSSSRTSTLLPPQPIKPRHLYFVGQNYIILEHRDLAICDYLMFLVHFDLPTTSMVHSQQPTPPKFSDPFVFTPMSRTPDPSPFVPSSVESPQCGNQLEYYERFGYPKLPDTAGEQYLPNPDPSPCEKVAER
jgi:hypothetical protein